ncbi:MAG: hypothetical protein A2Y77_14610 [Planctomycetes bacterium RBG_13_62_9]|nr:MAG: hypothetical protein A2Y77_14610 [Planctomycetes bacterium RBG_13_62_9]
MYGGATVGGRRGRTGQNTMDGTYGPGAADPTLRRRGGATTRGRGRGADDMGLYGGDMGYGYGPGADVTGKPSTNEVYNDLAGQLITYRTNLAELEEPVLIWAFDDTTQPGNTYEYRMRLGVFNPVAGTSQLVEQDLDKKNQIILWSGFSQVTKPVSIPQRMYFFAKDVQDPKRSATVEVARYCLGYWRSEDFEVKPGEAIGKQSKPRTDERRRPGALGGRITDPAYAQPGAYNVPLGLGVTAPLNPGGTDTITTPELIDYRTGNVLVDLVQVNDWGEAPNLRPRSYHEMLYTADGHRIEHMPVSMTNWPKDLLAAYNSVRTEVRKEPEPFRTFKKGGLRTRVQPGMQGGYEGMGGMYPDMMYNPGGPTPYR